jgi:hypothetical protein
MNAKDFLEEIDYYNTNVYGEIFEDLGIETLADILEVYHQRKLKLLGIGDVSQQRELLLAYEKQTQIYEYDEFDEWNTNKKIEQYLS